MLTIVLSFVLIGLLIAILVAALVLLYKAKHAQPIDDLRKA